MRRSKALICCCVVLSGFGLAACQSTAPRPNAPAAAVPSAPDATTAAAATAAASSAGAPVLQAVTLRTNVPTGLGSVMSVVPDFHFIAPKGNAIYLRRELVATNGNFAGANIRGQAINVPAEAQRQGAVLSGGWRCGVARYYVTLRAFIIDDDGDRSNAVEYTIHCNGG